MVLASTANKAVKDFMEDFYLGYKDGKFLADIDFSFNAHRKLSEGWVTIVENVPAHIVLSLDCIHCDNDHYPLYFDGSQHEDFRYEKDGYLEITGDHKNKQIGKFRVCIKPRETTW